MNFEDIMVSEISQSQKDKYCMITLLKKILFIYLFLAALGLRCCMQSFFSCSEWGLLFIVVCGLLIEVASLVVDHRL